jgi:hypothetical protein
MLLLLGCDNMTLQLTKNYNYPKVFYVFRSKNTLCRMIYRQEYLQIWEIRRLYPSTSEPSVSKHSRAKYTKSYDLIEGKLM